MAILGVNIDHVATVREARKTNEPDPVWAAALAELGGADAITIHLREDRRHIQDRDLRVLKEIGCRADQFGIGLRSRSAHDRLRGQTPPGDPRSRATRGSHHRRRIGCGRLEIENPRRRPPLERMPASS